jgi:hypothetical protein
MYNLSFQFVQIKAKNVNGDENLVSFIFVQDKHDLFHPCFDYPKKTALLLINVIEQR